MGFELVMLHIHLLWSMVINLSPLTLSSEKDDELPAQRPKSALQTVGLAW